MFWNVIGALVLGGLWSWHDSVYSKILNGTLDNNGENKAVAKVILFCMFGVLLIAFAVASNIFVLTFAVYGWLLHDVVQHYLTTKELRTLKEWIYVITFKENIDYFKLVITKWRRKDA